MLCPLLYPVMFCLHIIYIEVLFSWYQFPFSIKIIYVFITKYFCKQHPVVCVCVCVWQNTEDEYLKAVLMPATKLSTTKNFNEIGCLNFDIQSRKHLNQSKHWVICKLEFKYKSNWLSSWTDAFSLKLRQPLPGKCDFEFKSFIFYLFTYLYIGSSY